MDKIKYFKEKLVAIQWITNSTKFNEKQLIELGDALAAFEECIMELEVVELALEFLNE